ncbi:hypothetical protein ZOSMA_305G00010 [Zostera marina]|uniref:HMA domain-containing protein n=1 Tax=Zostera marina TaxID=29655 RepID=A0A0K9PA18_ZOSMR|nr:hypothetical protein ZOSMA_305G00010 [Zostera marina]
MKQKVVIKVQAHCDRCRKKAMELAAKEARVESVILQGKDKDEVMVVGEDVDSACLTTKLRKKLGYANILTIEEVDEEKILKEKLEKKKKEEEEKKQKEEKEKKIKEQEEKEKKEYERFKQIKKRCFLASLNLDCNCSDCSECAKPCVQLVPQCPVPVPPPPPYIPSSSMMMCRFEDDPCPNSCTIA